MKLRKYDCENVVIKTINGNIYEGYVGDYIFPDDNEPEVEGLILDNAVRVNDGYKYTYPIEFDAPDISEIRIK